MLTRPIRLGVLHEAIRTAKQLDCIRGDQLATSLGVSKPRAEEVLSQLTLMGLTHRTASGYALTTRGRSLLDAINQERLVEIDHILSEYGPYRTVRQLLYSRPFTSRELAEAARLSEVAVDSLLSLVMHANPTLRQNPRTHRYYLAREQQPDVDEFIRALRAVCSQLSQSTLFGISRPYIRIGLLRDYVCEQLAISPNDFDSLLSQVVEGRLLYLELVRAPVMSMPKHEREQFFLDSKNRRCYFLKMGEAKLSA